MGSRKDSDLRSVMQSREDALREVEKLVQHTETLERKYTEKVILDWHLLISCHKTNAAMKKLLKIH